MARLKKSCTAHTTTPPRAPKSSHRGSSGGRGAVMPASFPLSTNSTPMKAMASRETAASTDSLAR